MLLFDGHCVMEVFQTLHDYNLAGVLANHARFDDLDLISRSQIFQNNKLQMGCCCFLDSCPLWLKWCMVGTHMKQTKHSMLCVTDVYLIDIVNTFFSILHLNVSHQSLLFLFLS